MLNIEQAQIPPVAEVVPHGAPMILIDEIVRLGSDSIECRVDIREDSLFVRNGKVRTVVASEYMAQAVAAYVGMLDRVRGRPIQIGYLIGVRELKLVRPFVEVGDALSVEAQRVWGDDELGHFKTRVVRDGEEISRAALTVFRGELSDLRGKA